MDKPDVPPARPRSSHIVKETEMKNFAITIAAVLVSVPATWAAEGTKLPFDTYSLT